MHYFLTSQGLRLPRFRDSGTPDDIRKFSDNPPTATFIFIFDSRQDGHQPPDYPHYPLSHLQITPANSQASDDRPGALGNYNPTQLQIRH